jgi:hypothetical protein
MGHLTYCLDCKDARDESYIGAGRPQDFRRRSAVDLVKKPPFTPRPQVETAPPAALPAALPPEDPKEEKAMAENVIAAPAGFCPKHPTEKQIVIDKNGPRKGQLMGKCKKCLKESRAKRSYGPRKPKRKPDPKALAASGRVLVLIFDNVPDEDLWDDLHQEASEEFRTPEMQALHLIRVQLRGREAGE